MSSIVFNSSLVETLDLIVFFSLSLPEPSTPLAWFFTASNLLNSIPDESRKIQTERNFKYDKKTFNFYLVISWPSLKLAPLAMYAVDHVNEQVYIYAHVFSLQIVATSQPIVLFSTNWRLTFIIIVQYSALVVNSR